MPISMVCREAGKAGIKYVEDFKQFKLRYGRDPILVSDVGTTPAKLQKTHTRCNGKPGFGGANTFVCDCICHKPLGASNG